MSHQQPNGATESQVSPGAAQPQSWPQLSSSSSSPQTPSPQPAGRSQRLQSPMPILHFIFLNQPQSCEQAPQSAEQLEQVSPTETSQVSSSSQTTAAPSQLTPTSAQDWLSSATSSDEKPRLRAASITPWQASW